MSERAIDIEILLIEPPPAACDQWSDVRADIQHGQDVLPGAAEADGSVRFSATLRLKAPASKSAPVFLGGYAFGTPSERFLYLSWSGVTGGGARQMFRRMKIPLKAITWDHIDTLRDRPGAVLRATVRGTGRDGKPACATVPLVGGGWTVVPPAAG